MNVGVVLAGGVGNRFGSETPKQYQFINGKEVIGYVIDALKQSACTREILVVAGAPYLNHIREKYGVIAIEGGETRNQTVYNALVYIRENFPDCEKAVFADSVRPMLTADYLDEVDALLDSHEGVVTIAEVTDSLGNFKRGIVDRKEYFLIQTPEAFRMSALRDFCPVSDATALMQQCRGDLFYCDKLVNNFKITYPWDLAIADELLRSRK